jgi:hypothetical protein
VQEVVWEVLVEWGVCTRWLDSRLACDGPRRRRVRVGVGSKLKVGVMVVERNFAEFSGEFARDYFGKHHEARARVGIHGEDPAPSVVHTQDPKMKVSPRLKATAGLMKTETVEFAMRSSTRAPTRRASCRCFRPATYQGEYSR